MEANGRPGAWFVLQLHAPDAYPAAILIATLRGADYMNFDMGKIYMMITVAIVPIIIGRHHAGRRQRVNRIKGTVFRPGAGPGGKPP